MLLTVILLSSAIMGAAALAGLLIIYNSRNVADVVSSGQAIFAADAGLECALYNSVQSPGTAEDCGQPPASRVRFSNGAEFETQTDTVGSTTTIHSTGHSNNAARSFEASYVQI